MYLEYNDLCQRIFENDPKFQEAVAIARECSAGKVWLVGGYLYRSIIQEFYGTPRPEKIDVDFALESFQRGSYKLGIELESGKWHSDFQGRYGRHHFSGQLTARLACPDYSIDFISVSKLAFFRPSIEKYLSWVSLTVQSIAYDVDTHEVIGNVGKKAIVDKIVAIHNSRGFSKKTNGKISLEEYVREKAHSLGFRYRLDDPAGGLTVVDDIPLGGLSIADKEGRLSLVTETAQKINKH